MLGLRSAIQTIESQIETMYNEDFLRKLEYQLHAVMVHEGSIDSGHYWAYVLDHKRKVRNIIKPTFTFSSPSLYTYLGVAKIQ